MRIDTIVEAFIWGAVAGGLLIAGALHFYFVGLDEFRGRRREPTATERDPFVGEEYVEEFSQRIEP